jgi:hypothetical protein
VDIEIVTQGHSAAMRRASRVLVAAAARGRVAGAIAAPARVIARAASTVPATPSVTAAAVRNAAVASVMHSGADAEDLAVTLAGVNPAVAAGVVRPIAVVKVGGEIITKELDTLAASLKVLRESGLQVAVVHGGGPQLNDELAKAGVKPEYIGGEAPAACLPASQHAGWACAGADLTRCCARACWRKRCKAGRRDACSHTDLYGRARFRPGPRTHTPGDACAHARSDSCPSSPRGPHAPTLALKWPTHPQLIVRLRLQSCGRVHRRAPWRMH